MDVRIDANGRPTILDVDDFTSLRLSGTAPSSPAARMTLDKCGIEVGEGDTHAYIEPATLARLAGAAAGSSTWRAGLDEMFRYATDKGWTDGGRIRVHTEWTD